MREFQFFESIIEKIYFCANLLLLLKFTYFKKFHSDIKNFDRNYFINLDISNILMSTILSELSCRVALFQTN
jgi:hypothetical protein